MGWKSDQRRYVFLYTNSREQKARYEELAKAAGTSLNKFLLSKIEDGLNPKPAIDPKELIALQEENKKLRDKIKVSRILISRYEEDLKKVEVATVVQFDDTTWNIIQNLDKFTDEDIINLNTEQLETLKN